MKVIYRGAEAILYKESDDVLVKERIPKKYRLKELDSKLIISRTKKEAKILKKLDFAPKIIETDNKSIIKMEFLKGDVLKKVIELKHAALVAKKVSLMHDLDVVHGDLTTSNMFLVESQEIKIIDFGLSYISKKVEDKAVDLHLLKQALISKHYDISVIFWDKFIKEYNPKDKKEILQRLKKVEMRGKNKK
ncbi:MAG: KEOPS complex kinase/ATPase Bud32 [Candidatus Woesearchaeota archaeon]